MKKKAKTPAQNGALKKERQKLFLKEFAKCGVIFRAAEKASLNRSTHYEWLKLDVEYSRAFSDVKEEYIEKLEAEADRRAVEGVDRPVFYDGNVVGHIREYSDTLLIFRLKALKPEKYRESYHITGKVEHGLSRETLDAIMQDPKARQLAREMTSFLVKHLNGEKEIQ